LIKGIVHWVNDEILDVTKMWQNERLQQQKMTTSAIDKHTGYGNNLAISFWD
jgi:hypothetical protein